MFPTWAMSAQRSGHEPRRVVCAVGSMPLLARLVLDNDSFLKQFKPHTTGETRWNKDAVTMHALIGRKLLLGRLLNDISGFLETAHLDGDAHNALTAVGQE